LLVFYIKNCYYYKKEFKTLYYTKAKQSFAIKFLVELFPKSSQGIGAEPQGLIKF